MAAMDVSGFEYNEPVANLNVVTAVQALVNHVKNTMDTNNKIETIKSDVERARRQVRCIVHGSQQEHDRHEQ